MNIFRKSKKETESEIDILNNQWNSPSFSSRYSIKPSWPFIRKLTEEEILMRRKRALEICKQMLREVEEKERLNKEKLEKERLEREKSEKEKSES